MKKKTIISLLVGVLLLNTGCSFWKSSYNDYELSDVTLGTSDFSEMKYEHYDTAKVEEMIESIREDMKDEDHADQVVESFEEMDDELNQIGKYYTLAQIYSSIDATDEYYQKELVYMTEVYNDIFDKISVLGQDALKSECADALKEVWSEEDIEYFEEYEALNDKEKELKSTEQELINQYNVEAVKTYTYTINKKEYALDELLDAVYNGEISYEQYVEGYYGCINATADVLAPIYVDLVKTRMQIAKEAGYDNYNDYAYEESYERDYTPEDAQEFCDEVKETLVPAFNSFANNIDYSSISATMDEVANQYSAEEQFEMISKYLDKVDPVLASNYEYMKKYHLYDIAHGDKKSDGGYTVFIPVYNQPFIYVQPTESFYDVMTYVHEFGHYNSYCVNVNDAAGAVQNLDLAEIASQALELLYTDFYGDMLGEQYAEYAEDYTLYQRVDSVLEGCLYDEFQRNVYLLDEDEVTVEKINAIFTEVGNEYYNGYYAKGMGDTFWTMISHNFESPLYYISYAVSVVPALEVWEIAQEDFDEARETYMEIVRAGESNGYKETLEEIGVGTPFDGETIPKIAEMITKITK